MSRRAQITTLHAVAKTRREGFLEACYKTGKVTEDGRWIVWDDETHAALRKEFNSNPPTPKRSRLVSITPEFELGTSESSIGLGDAIHKITGPIGRAVRWPCMKGDGSTDLKPGSPCAKARELANKIKL